MAERSDGRGPGPAMSGRKRGHQHHVRNSGTRRSNVPADEVIAALRGQPHSSDTAVPEAKSNQEDIVMCAETENDNSDTNANRIALTELKANASASDLINSNVNTSPPVARAQLRGKNNNKDDDISSDLSESTTGSTKKTKSKRDGSKRSSKNRDSPLGEQRKRRPRDAPRGERPPLEGAADNDSSGFVDADIADIENDPEAAEWAKLRCTSERTEVVAEREYRRQNRRCADYPGLAFGRSIFSSDTMMKLNIIRNELHNIMKTQLKRVRCWATSMTIIIFSTKED